MNILIWSDCYTMSNCEACYYYLSCDTCSPRYYSYYSYLVQECGACPQFVLVQVIAQLAYQKFMAQAVMLALVSVLLAHLALY
ncbi:unnamed protein product [Paramecium sonneborni]|uniref:Uncharacterized protein n=1 Tax=Paramecium sonneborni TaxID=65129 RepID=A0A8S1RNG7_9CILI|nr:unnamed protein product [Paramecium sonneborni]